MRSIIVRGIARSGLLSILGLLLATSCQRLPLYDEEGNMMLDIAIDYNIKNAPDVPEPEMMFVGFYDLANGNLVRTEYTGPRGGEIFVIPAKYHMLVYNFDTEATIVSGNTNIYETEAYTSNVPSQVSKNYQAMLQKIKEYEARATRVRSYEDQPLINEPDHLFASHVADVEVPVRVADDRLFTIHTDASSLVQTYSLTIGPINGMEYIASADVFVTGQVQSRLVATRKIIGVPSTIYFPIEMATRRNRSNMLTTTFNTFGKYPGADNTVVLVVKITDQNGNVTVVETDVTDQFDDPDNTEGHIEIDQEINIEPSGGTGGFLPTVTIWDDFTTDINI